MIAVTLRGSRIRIGRAPDNDIQLTHDSIADYHAELVETPGGAIIRTLNSASCTVNGIIIRDALLSPNDKVCFGDLEADFLTIG
jgi:pSer/pThr/pTyr-binding forkhead associated (FHA) protein